MTLEELELKYSWGELAKIPGDGDLRFQLFSPILKDLYENKIVYYERFMCVAILDDVKITPVEFKAKAIPYLKIERAGSRLPFYPEKPWTFGAKWSYMSLSNGHFSTYGGMWQFWTDKELVKTVEDLVRKKEFETALESTLYKRQ
jgi:hypothetical protein